MKQLLVILLVFFSACAVQKSPVKNYSFDVLSVSRAGGFTGNVSGYSIDRNGEISLIYQFKGKPAQQQFFRQTTLDSVQMLFDKVEQTGINQMTHHENGNMTLQIAFQKAGDIHAISFIEAKDTAKKFSPIYYEIRDFAAGRGKIK
jgi:hypothetical protein